MNILFDSGANCSVIDFQLALSLGATIGPIQPGSVRVLLSADSSQIYVCGETMLTFSVGKFAVAHKFAVVKGLSTRIICGLDFIVKHGVVCDYAEGEATINFGEVKTPFVRKQNFVGIAYLSYDVTVPPHSEEAISVLCNAKVPAGESVLLQVFNTIHKHVSIIPTVNSNGNELKVKLCNQSGKQVKLKKLKPVCAVVRMLKAAPTGQAMKPRTNEFSNSIPIDTHPTIDFSIRGAQNTTMKDQESQLTTDEVRINATPRRTFEDLNIKMGDRITNDAEAKPFRDLMSEYSDCFAMSNTELTGCKLAECKFELKNPDSPPIKCKNFPLSADDRTELEKQVRQMEKDGLIQKSMSPYNSPVMLVKKHDGSKRVVVDMRKINTALKDEVYNTPTLREMIERIGASKAKIFSLYDLRAAYQQIIISKESRKYTSFTCSLGNFQYCRLPFGLKLSGNFFNYVVQNMIAEDEILSKHCLNYVDDVIIFTQDLETHRDCMKRLFIVLRNAGLKIHNGKCDILQSSVQFVGHRFGTAGIEPLTSKIDAMLSFPRPVNKKTLRSFIGMVSFYRAYIKNLTHDLEPLLELLSKNIHWSWSERHEAAFQQIKGKLKELPTLKYPDEEPGAGAYIITTDASNLSIAGLIAQKSRDGKSEDLIACYGRSLRTNEVNWTTGEKECLAMIIAVIKFRHLIVGKPLIIRSDNLSVRYFSNLRNESAPRLIRWSMYLSDILSNTTFEHVKGKHNIVPDALSRRHYPDEDKPTNLELELVHDVFTLVSLNNAMTEDHDDQDETDLQTLWDEKNDTEHIVESKLKFEESDEEEEANEGKTSPENSEEDDTEDDEEVVENADSESSQVLRDGTQIFILHKEIVNQEDFDDKELVNAVQNQLLHIMIGQENKGPTTSSNSEQVQNESSNDADDNQPFTISPAVDQVQRDQPQTSTTSINDAEATVNSERMQDITYSTESRLQRLQKNCEEIGPMVAYLKDGTLPETNNKLCRKIVIESENHFLDEEGVLWMYKRNKNKRTQTIGDMNEWRVIPRKLRKEILEGIHEFGHAGINKTMAVLDMCKYRWPGVYTDVKNVVLACENCTTGKRGLPKPTSKIESLEKPSRCGEIIYTDVVGPLDKTEDGNVYIFTALDAMSNFIWLIPMKDQTAETIAECLMTVVSYIGIPEKLVSDLGKNLMSKVMDQLCTMLKITRMQSLVYMHTANKVERQHRVVGDMLRTMLRGTEVSKWDKSLSLIQLIMRSTPTMNYPYSPSEVLHGFQMRIPVQAQVDDFGKAPEIEVSEYVADLKAKLQRLYKAQDTCRQMCTEASVNIHNKKAKPYPYAEGMLVYLKNEAKKPGVSAKLQLEYIGPYKLIKKFSDHSFSVENVATGKLVRNQIHVDRMKPVKEIKTKNYNDAGQKMAEKTPLEEVPGPDAPGEVSVEPDEKIDTTQITNNHNDNGGDSTQHGPVAESHQSPWGVRDDVYIVERLTKVRGPMGNREYLVKWAPINGVRSRDSWIRGEDITPSAINAFYEKHTQAGKLRKQFQRRNRRPQKNEGEPLITGNLMFYRGENAGRY